MIKSTPLYTGKFIKLSQLDDGFEIVDESDGIAVMPVIRTKENIYTVIRKEYVPPYFIKNEDYKLWYTAISGTLDDGDSDEMCMLRELKEEAGMNAISYKILFERHNIPIYKGSTRRTALYIVNLQSIDMYKMDPDNSKSEKLSKSLIIKVGDLKNIIEKQNCDYFLYSFAHIFMEVLRNNYKI